MNPKDAAELAKIAASVGAGNLALGIVGITFIGLFVSMLTLAVWSVRQMLKNGAERGREDRTQWTQQQNKTLESHERIVTSINETHKEQFQKMTHGIEKLSDAVTDVKGEIVEIRSRLEEAGK
jgi:ethanolamine utilization protein EutA (predicted chaperonin)